MQSKEGARDDTRINTDEGRRRDGTEMATETLPVGNLGRPKFTTEQGDKKSQRIGNLGAKKKEKTGM